MKCRICDSSKLNIIFESSDCPVASHKFPREPLKNSKTDIQVYKCEVCDTVQLDKEYTENYADDYQRNTSFSSSANEFMKENINLIKKYVPKNNQLLEVGCGDGFFLSLLKDDFKVLGVEPSKAAYNLAKQRGIEVINDYFGEKTLSKKADAIIMRFVLEHIFDLKNLFNNIKKVLNKKGKFILELPNYDKMLMDGRYFEFFREHVFYFNPTSISFFLEKQGFRLLHSHTFMNDEYFMGVYELRDEIPFSKSFLEIKEHLQAMLSDASVQSVCFWGASGGGVSLISYADLPIETMKYIIDSDNNKHGLYTFGSGLQIVSPEILKTEKIDGIIIMSTTYEDEIKKKLLEQYHFKGKIGSIRGIPKWLN